MAQIGTIKLSTNTGVKDVPIFDTGDVDNPIVRIQTDTGTGALNLVDPPNAELDELRFQTETNGVLAVSTSIAEGDMVVTHSLNGQSADIIVYEDTTGNGTADNIEKVSLVSGTSSYTLEQISGGPGNEYWIQVVLENKNIEKTAVIEDIQLSI